MKKKIWLWIAAGALLLAVLFVPVPTGAAEDGGTQVYSALTYKIVKWHRSTEDGIYSATRVYWLPDNFKSIDKLWDGEDRPQPSHRREEYTGQWLDKEKADAVDDSTYADLIITDIYANCFFARNVIPLPQTLKINGRLSEEWCVGDQVKCTYENIYYDQENQRIEADLRGVEPSEFELEPGMDYKPVIYLYPEEETEVTVQLRLRGKLTCTYPAYGEGWKVTAAPDGTLTDAKGQTYSYLYWEGETYARWDMSKGFCVKGSDTAAFLEQALEKLGLTRREANEFIVYWLPLMEQNPYNVIAFQTEAYTEAAALHIDPAPDTLLRVFMAWRGSDSFVELTPQTLTAPARTGFTVVEWGGTVLTD